jgi:hypothetical protein
MLASKVKFEATTYIPSLCITWESLYMTLHALVLFILTWALILVHRCQSENLAATTVLLDSLAPEGNTSLSALCASSWWLSLHTCLDLTGHREEGYPSQGHLCIGWWDNIQIYWHAFLHTMRRSANAMLSCLTGGNSLWELAKTVKLVR